jgi:hypothetical protein
VEKREVQIYFGGRDLIEERAMALLEIGFARNLLRAAFHLERR